MNRGIEGNSSGYFSRIKKGEATLQADLTAQFCAIVGNRIYPEWMAYRVGCTLVQIQSEAERLLEAERAKNAKLAERLAYAESLMVRRQT